MANMNNNNNWLGFSLSPQDHQPNFNSSDEISTTQISGDSCFDSAIPSLNRPFGILEAFNTNNNHPQVEWNMNDVSLNTYSCSSSSSQQQQNMEDSRPKLENFLGIHQNHHDTTSSSCNYNLYQQQTDHATANNTNNIGLSMITNWLRNSNKDEEAAPAPAAAPQTLSLCMSTGSQSSSSDAKIAAATAPATATAAALALVEGQTQTPAAIESVPRKSIDTFGQRTSIYRGVTRHRWTGRYEAHLWDNSCRREGQTRKGRQVYLGGYDKEDKAARAYDLAALKYWGTTTTTNFPMSNYEKEIEEMKHMTRQEYVASLRRKSSGFSRGASMYRGVTRHHQHGRWQARIGRVAGNKDLYLGTFSTEEEAAEAYDIAAIKFRGLNAVTNFEINRYDVKSILESSTLPIGGAAKRLKDAEKAEMALLRANEASNTLNLHLTDHTTHHQMPYSAWPTIAFQPSSHQPLSYPPHFQRLWCKQENNDGFNDINHQLQLGNNNTHNFMHNIMDSSNTTSAASMMMGTVIVPDATHGFMGQDEGKNLEYEAAMFGSADHHAAYQQARTTANYYSNYQQQQQSKSTNMGLYDQGSSANWIPTAVPTNMAAAAAAAAACHGASTFTVWNDT